MSPSQASPRLSAAPVSRNADGTYYRLATPASQKTLEGGNVQIRP